MDIEHRPETERFVALLEGDVVGSLRYRRTAGGVDALSTQTDPARRGQGIAGRVVDAFADWAATEGLPVRSFCWYVTERLGRDPEREHLLVG